MTLQIGLVRAPRGLNLRAEPSTDAQVITAVSRGTQVTVLDRTDDGEWFNIEIPTGETGWVLSQWIEITGTVTLGGDSSVANRSVPETCDGHTADALPTGTEITNDALLLENVEGGEDLGLSDAPGSVLIASGSDWMYHKAVGVADTRTGEPFGCTRSFEIGDNTKMMTGAVLLQLEEEGRLSLDDLLSDYLPGLAARIPNGDRITLRHLATHTSGLADYAGNDRSGIIGGGLANTGLRVRGYSPLQLIEFAIGNGTPGFEPGAEGRWAYSNTGYVLLGLVIEDVTGHALDDVFRERIFEPLGMTDTFLWSDVPGDDVNLPNAYYGESFEISTRDWNLSQSWAAGGVISTAPDMRTFVDGLFGGGLFRDSATLDRMLDAVPAFGRPFTRYGIGVAEIAPGTWGHGGQTPGFESYVVHVPDAGFTLVAWTNAAAGFPKIGGQSTD